MVLGCLGGTIQAPGGSRDPSEPLPPICPRRLEAAQRRNGQLRGRVRELEGALTEATAKVVPLSNYDPLTPRPPPFPTPWPGSRCPPTVHAPI